MTTLVPYRETTYQQLCEIAAAQRADIRCPVFVDYRIGPTEPKERYWHPGDTEGGWGAARRDVMLLTGVPLLFNGDHMAHHSHQEWLVAGSRLMRLPGHYMSTATPRLSDLMRLWLYVGVPLAAMAMMVRCECITLCCRHGRSVAERCSDCIARGGSIGPRERGVAGCRDCDGKGWVLPWEKEARERQKAIAAPNERLGAPGFIPPPAVVEDETPVVRLRYELGWPIRRPAIVNIDPIE